jgi:superfamily II DNA or RNA helicase
MSFVNLTERISSVIETKMIRVREVGKYLEIEAKSLVRNVISDNFKVPHPNASSMKQRAPHLAKWDGMIKFFEESGDKLLIKKGFSERLRDVFKEEELLEEVDWEDSPEFDPITYIPDLRLTSDDGGVITLDTIQVEALEELLKHQCCCIELGTGSGKTEIFIKAALDTIEAFPDAKILIIEPKRKLIQQTYQRILRRLPQLADSVGRLGDGKCELKQIVVATANSATDNPRLKNYEAIREWMHGVKVVILDECHHGKAISWQRVVSEVNADFNWAVSGKVTFEEKLKTFELESLFGKPVYVGMSETRTCPVVGVYHNIRAWNDRFKGRGLSTSLKDETPVFFKMNPSEKKWREGFWRGPDAEGKVERWMLKKVKKGSKVTYARDKAMYGIYTDRHPSPREPDPLRVEEIPDDIERVDPPDDLVVYRNAHDIGIMEFNDRNLFAVELALEVWNKREPFMITVKRKRHLHKMVKLFKKYVPQIKVEVVDGSMSGTKQEKVFEDLKNLEIEGVICQYTIGSEGVDVPNLVHLIKLDGTTGEQILTQQKGRVQRSHHTKITGYIHFFRDGQHSGLLKNSQTMRRRLESYGVKVKMLTHIGWKPSL